MIATHKNKRTGNLYCYCDKNKCIMFFSHTYGKWVKSQFRNKEVLDSNYFNKL